MSTENTSHTFVRQKTYSTALFVLNSTLVERKYPDILISGLFKKEHFSTSEKAAVIDLTYGVLRHITRLDHIIEHASSAVVSGLDLKILNIIRICTFHAVFTAASPAGIIKSQSPENIPRIASKNDAG